MKRDMEVWEAYVPLPQSSLIFSFFLSYLQSTNCYRRNAAEHGARPLHLPYSQCTEQRMAMHSRTEE